MRKRLAALAAVTALLACAAPVLPAAAHEGNPNFESVVHGLERPVEGVSISVLNYDDSLELVNRSGKDLLLYGYEDEPYARLLADGTVETNANSPSVYLNDDRFAEASVPGRADPEAPPQWTPVSDDGRFVWHDHRMHWMARSTPPQVKDEGRRTKVFDYRIPMRVGGEPDAIEGTLWWVGPADSSKLPFLLAGGALLLLGGAAVLAIRSRREGDPGERDEKEAW